MKTPRLTELVDIRARGKMSPAQQAELIIEDKKMLGKSYDKSLEAIAYAKEPEVKKEEPKEAVKEIKTPSKKKK